MNRALAIGLFMAVWTWIGLKSGVMAFNNEAEVAALVFGAVFSGIILTDAWGRK